MAATTRAGRVRQRWLGCRAAGLSSAQTAPESAGSGWPRLSACPAPKLPPAGNVGHLAGAGGRHLEVPVTFFVGKFEFRATVRLFVNVLGGYGLRNPSQRYGSPASYFVLAQGNTMKRIVPLLLLTSLSSCTTPADVSQPLSASSDKNVDFTVTDTPAGFNVEVRYSRYQFMPETGALFAACRSALTARAYEEAKQRNRAIEPINEQEIRVSAGRNIVNARTACRAFVAVRWQTASASQSEQQATSSSLGPVPAPAASVGPPKRPAKTPSGFCYDVPKGYGGTGSAKFPALTDATPACYQLLER